MKIFYIIGIIEIIITYFTYMKMGYMYNSLTLDIIIPSIFIISIVKLIIIIITYTLINYSTLFNNSKLYMLLKLYYVILVYTTIKNIIQVV